MPAGSDRQSLCDNVTFAEVAATIRSPSSWASAGRRIAEVEPTFRSPSCRKSPRCAHV